jgi:hypothetical protein
MDKIIEQKRIYKLPINKEIKLNNKEIINLERFENTSNIKFNKKKIFEKYKITKKRYLNIFQEIRERNTLTEIITYVEEFKFIEQSENYIIFKYTKTILDNREFPPLNKYDFEENYDEEVYEVIYKNIHSKLISNQFEQYIEIS